MKIITSIIITTTTVLQFYEKLPTYNEGPDVLFGRTF